MSNLKQDERENLRQHFQQNMLDGDTIQSGQMLSSESVFDYILDDYTLKTEATAAQERAVAEARERGYRLGSQKTLQDLLLHLPSELSTPRAIKLLKEYTILVQVYADIRRRHDTVAAGALVSARDALVAPQNRGEG